MPCGSGQERAFLCDTYIEGMVRASAKSKATYRSNFASPAVRTLLDSKSMLDVARMDAEVKTLLNTTLGRYSIETTLHFCIHASASAEQRISAMMNARWTAKPAT